MHPALALAFAAVVQGSGAPEPAAKAVDDPSRVEFLWTGMVDGRQRLRSGVFRAHGRLLDDDPNLWGRLEGDVEIFCAFDVDKNLFRFDRREPGRVVPKGAKVVPGVKWTRAARGGKYIRVSGKTLSLEDGAGQVEINKEDWVFPLAKPFDPRCVGLLYWRDLDRSTPFDELVKMWMTVRPEGAVEEADGVARVRWTTPKTNPIVLRRDLWIDTKRGFTPIRHELRNRRPSDPEDRWSEAKTVSEATWAEVSGVWVPKTFRVEEKHASPQVKRIELALEWESVNRPVPAALFTVEGLRLPVGDMVVDSRTGKPITVAMIGKGHKPEVGAGPFGPPEGVGSGGKGADPGRGHWPTTLLGVNVAAIAAIVVGSWVYRRRRAARGAPRAGGGR